MTILHRVATFFAAGFGSGWLPKAPGTWGSLAALLPGWLILDQFGVAGLAVVTLIFLLLGCFACRLILPRIGADDPGWIVVDEWVGQWLTLMMVVLAYGLMPVTVAAAFLAFRFFDILKPFPIRRLEHVGPPWWSIMADDLMAGVMGGAVVILMVTVMTAADMTGAW